MKIINLYKYERDGGGMTVSPIQPAEGVPYTEMYRVVADEGMLVTQDGTNKYPVIDTDTDVGWYEVEGEQRPDPLAEFVNSVNKSED